MNCLTGNRLNALIQVSILPLFLLLSASLSPAVVVAFTVYSINSKAIGLKVLQPVALSTAPLVIVHCLGCIAVVGEDYCCSLADTAYFAYLLVSRLQALAYTALVTFTQVNAGLAALVHW